MEVRYFRIIARWLWLLILIPIITIGATFFIVNQETQMYQAVTRLIVGPGIDNPSPDLNDLRAGAQLMETYAEFPTTQPFLLRVIEETNLRIPPAQLIEMIEVQTNEETQILRIQVVHEDPDTAQLIAGVVAQELVNISPSGSSTPAGQLKTQILNQVTILEANIEETQARIEQLENDLQNPLTPSSQSILLGQLNDERDRLAEAQRTILPLYEALQEATTNQVKIIESDRDVVPVDSQLPLKLVIGASVGLILGAGIVLSMEYLSDAIETVDDLYSTTKLPVLGTIVSHRIDAANPLVVRAAPQSTAAENFRSLGVKLFFADDGRWRTRSLLISGIELGGDAGEVAANLGVILSQTGLRVTIIDADLHSPVLHELFGVPNNYGLTTVLTSFPGPPKLVSVPWAPGLSLLCSGPRTADGFGVLASPLMQDMIQQLTGTDIVLLIGPPLSIFADSLFLSSRVDGMIVAAKNAKSRRQRVRNAINSLRDVGANVLGFVITDSPGASVQQIKLTGVGTAPSKNGKAEEKKKAAASEAKKPAPPEEKRKRFYSWKRNNPSPPPEQKPN